MYSVHRAFYLWALILSGLIISALINRHPENLDTANTWTWVYIWILFYTFVLLLFDIGTAKLILCTASFALIWLAIRYLEMTKNIPVIKHIKAYFEALKPTMTGGMSTTISLLLLVPWVIMVEESYRCGRKSFSPNGIEERSIGVSKEITDRTGLHFV